MNTANLSRTGFRSIVTELCRRESPRATAGCTGSFNDVAQWAVRLLLDSGLELLAGNEPTGLAAHSDAWLVGNVVALYNEFARTNWISRYEDPSNLDAAVKLYQFKYAPNMQT